GDEIRIGESVFVSTVEPPSASNKVEEGSQITLLRPAESVYLSPAERNLPITARVSRDLRTLLRLSKLLNSMRSLHGSRGRAGEAIHERLSALLLDLIPADRATVVLADSDNLLVQRVRKEHVALWSQETAAGTMAIAAPL